MSAPLPTGTRWVAATPGTTTTIGALPTGTRARLPSGMYVPPPIAASTAEGILIASAIPSTTAAFTTTGALEAGSAPTLAAVFTAEGVFVFPTDRLDALSSTTGTLGATAVPTALAQFTATGSLSGVQAAAPTAEFTAVGELLIPTSQATGLLEGEGQLAATAVPTALAEFTATAGLTTTTYGSSVAAFTAAGTTSAPLVASAGAPFSGAGTLGAVAVSFAPSGMTKNGSVAWTTGTAWVTIQNWTANTGTYPGSSVDGSHRLVVQGSKTGATISGQAAYTGGGFARTHSIRVVDQTGAVIATGAPNTNTSGNCTVTATGVNLSGITALELQMSGDFSAGTMSAGAGTFLTVT